jgi:hypothetical protein
MKGRWRPVTVLLALAATLVFVTASAGGSGLGNGDFERGDFTNWNTASSTTFSSWFVYSGKQAPPAGASIDPPPQGAYAAVAGQLVPSTVVLYRTLPLGTTKTQQVSFYEYYRNRCESGFFPGEQDYRADILLDGADPFSTDPGDILKTLFRASPGDPQTMKPTLRKYVLSGLSGPVTLRFLVNAYCAPLVGAVDNVRLQSAS